MRRKPRVISLYSGAGGLDYGLEAAGFKVAVALEYEPDCCATLRRNRSWPLIEASIFDVSSETLLKRAKLKPGEADLLVGGPPCQPFSKSGYWANGDTLRLDDPRSDTLGAYLRVLRDALPKAFLLENVDGLAYSGKAEGLSLLLAEIEKINRETGARYAPEYTVLRAADYGVPQTRDRLFMVASRDGQAFRFPQPTHGSLDQLDGKLPLGQLEPYRTAWDAIGDVVPDKSEDLEPRGKWAGLLPSIPEGQNYLWHTARGGGYPLFGWRRRYWSFLLKLAKNRPSWTIQAQPGPAIGPFHWSNRRLSMRELCRIQTFPDDVVIFGSRGSVQRQVGNAVPSLLAEVLGREIGSQLLGLSRPSQAPRLMPPDRSPAPKPERRGRVPKRYERLIGDHPEHPGTSRGYAASSRRRLET